MVCGSCPSACLSPAIQGVLIDTDRRSDNDAWATGGRIEGNPDELIAQVTRKRIGRHHQNVCKVASVFLGVT